MTEQEMTLMTPLDDTTDTIGARDTDDMGFIGEGDTIAEFLNEIDLEEEVSILDTGFHFYTEREPDLVPHRPEETVYNIFSQEDYLLDSGAMCHVTNSSEPQD